MKSVSPPGHGLTEGKEYNLKLGSSFQKGGKPQESYHVLRYDFKPASIDTSQSAEVKFGKECAVTYHHGQGSTTFKGGRMGCQKECILIIDKTTGEITLERISSDIPLKKSRTGTVDRSGDIRKSGNPPLKNKPNAKSNHKSHENTSSASSQQTSNPASSQQTSNPSSSQQTSNPSSSNESSQTSSHKHNSQPHKQSDVKQTDKSKDSGGSSSSDSSDSDSSDSDSDLEEHAKALDSYNTIPTPYEPPPPSTDQPPVGATTKGNNILQDLQLSDSDSDSDSGSD